MKPKDTTPARFSQHGLASYSAWYVVIVGLWLTSGTALNYLAAITDSHHIHQTILRVAWFSVSLVGLTHIVFKPKKVLAEAIAASPALWALLVVAWLSILWSPDALSTLRASTLLTVSFVVGYILADQFRERKAWLAIFILLAILLLTGAWRVAVNPHTGTDGGMWKGFFGQKNWFGYAASISIVIGTGLIVSAKEIIQRAILFSLICCLFWLLLRSQSVTALFCCVAGLLAMGLAYAISRNLIRWRICIGFIILALGLASLNASDLFALFDREPDLTGRLGIWHQLLPIILDHPWLGYGYDGYLKAEGTPERLGSWREMLLSGGDTHNGFVRLMLDLGLVGASLGLLVFIHLLVRAVNWIRSAPLTPSQLICIGLWTLVFVHQIAEPSIFLPGHYTITLLVFSSIASFDTVKARLIEPSQPRLGPSLDEQARR